ncbi:hypothetical protein [Vibrio rumoiensis]|uniref:DUF2946 domain-containing protein n=2 Tax=Vibrio rumoiensis TaxID=76258 RepID=A0ABW7ISC6_9VIBR
MPVLMLTATQCNSDNMQHQSANRVSSMLDHSNLSESSLVKNACHSINVQSDNSNHHKHSMTDDCCDSTCVASYVYLPTPNDQLIEQSSLLLIEPSLPLLISRPSNSLYRPPIA